MHSLASLHCVFNFSKQIIRKDKGESFNPPSNLSTSFSTHILVSHALSLSSLSPLSPLSPLSLSLSLSLSVSLLSSPLSLSLSLSLSVSLSLSPSLSLSGVWIKGLW